MATHAREMRHTYVFVFGFLYQRESAKKLIGVRKAQPEIVEEAAIDLVDDLEMPRQQPSKQWQRPSFQRLGKERMVRVSAGLLRDSPGLIPLHCVLVHEEPHQFGDGDGRMHVVQLCSPIQMQ